MKNDQFKSFRDVGGDNNKVHAILGPHQVDGSPAWYVPRKDVRTFPKRFPESYENMESPEWKSLLPKMMAGS